MRETGGEREALVLSQRSVELVAERDRLYGRRLERSRERFVQIVRSTPALIKTIRDELRPGEYYRAVVPPDVQRGLRKGTLELVNKEKSGLFSGMVREASGKKRYVSQTDWVKETPDPQALANLNTMSIQAGIADVTDLLLDLDKKLDLVLRGQHSDRVAKVKAGVDLYEQTYYCHDEGLRKMQLANAVQSLNEGRRMLMEHLSATLQFECADPSTWQRILRAVSRGKIDEVKFEYVTALEKEYPAVKEDVRYANLATAYLFRAHVLLNEDESAAASVRQHEAFYALLAEDLPEKATLLPYEGDAGVDLVALSADFDSVRPRLLALATPQEDLVVEVSYEEVHDGV